MIDISGAGELTTGCSATAAGIACPESVPCPMKPAAEAAEAAANAVDSSTAGFGAAVSVGTGYAPVDPFPFVGVEVESRMGITTGEWVDASWPPELVSVEIGATLANASLVADGSPALVGTDEASRMGETSFDRMSNGAEVVEVVVDGASTLVTASLIVTGAAVGTSLVATGAGVSLTETGAAAEVVCRTVVRYVVEKKNQLICTNLG